MAEVKARVVRDDGVEMTFGDGDWRIPNDGLEGWATLPLEVSSTELPSYDGAVVTSSRVSSQVRTVKAMARKKGANEELRARALKFFRPKSTYEVHLTYMGRTRWASGELMAFSASEGNVYRPAEVMFTILCPNPYLQSESNFGKDIAEVSPRFGFPLMLFLPVSEGSVPGFNVGGLVSQHVFAREVELSNDGDVPSGIRAVIRAKGDVTNPMLKVGNGYTRLIATLHENDEVALDNTTRPPRVTLNGENAMNLVDRNSSILNMSVEVGGTTMEYDADDGYQNMNVAVYYNKQYQGV